MHGHPLRNVPLEQLAWSSFDSSRSHPGGATTPVPRALRGTLREPTTDARGLSATDFLSHRHLAPSNRTDGRQARAAESPAVAFLYPLTRSPACRRALSLITPQRPTDPSDGDLCHSPSEPRKSTERVLVHSGPRSSLT